MTAPLWGYQAIVKQLIRLLARDSRSTARQGMFAGALASISPKAVCGWATAATLQLMLLGCAGADVAVQSTRLPVPLVESLPINVGIHLSDELLTYYHEETVRNYGTFRINVGSAQSLMFDNLATGLFAGHRFVETPVSAAADLNAILVPTINELQFSIPAQTKSDFFEVWLKYSFELKTPDGNTIAEWPMQAYGRANSRNYGILEDTDNGALQEASRVALRDAMAVFSFKFQRVPAVKAWLEARTGTTTPPAVELTDTGGNNQ